MIELLFVACVAGSPGDCQERSLLFVDVSPMACMMGAQPELAKWNEAHPQFQIASWRCRMVSTAEMDI